MITTETFVNLSVCMCVRARICVCVWRISNLRLFSFHTYAFFYSDRFVMVGYYTPIHTQFNLFHHYYNTTKIHMDTYLYALAWRSFFHFIVAFGVFFLLLLLFCNNTPYKSHFEGFSACAMFVFRSWKSNGRRFHVYILLYMFKYLVYVCACMGMGSFG